MHPRIDEILRHLEAKRADLRSAVDAVPAELRSEKPSPESWSVANVLEHLAILEGRFGRILGDRIAQARAEGLRQDPETSSVVHSANPSTLLDRSRKIVAPPTGQPTGLDADTAFAQLEAARKQTVAIAISADGLALQDLMHTHPVLGPLSFYQWLATMGWHEARHTAQIVEIGEALKGA